MSKSVTWHLAVWSILLFFWLVAAVFTEHANGPMFSNKYLYSMEPSTRLPSDDVTRINKILATSNNQYSDTKAWPSGQYMNMFKNELGCFGDYNEDVHAALDKGTSLNSGILDKSNLMHLQHMYNPSPISVCSCIDQLYFASFWKEGQLPSSVIDKLSIFLNSSSTSGQMAGIKSWMLGPGAYGGQAGLGASSYDGTGFVSLMQTARSTDTDSGVRVFTCSDENVKTDTVKMDVTQCVMRRDAAILSVCTRSAQGVQVIESRGSFNASRLKNLGVMSLFLYMFLTLFRHTDQNIASVSEDKKWNHRWVQLLSVVLPAHLIGMLYFAVNVWSSIHYGELSRSEPNRAGTLSVLVVTVTLVGVLDALYTVFGVCRNAWLDRRPHETQEHQQARKTFVQRMTEKDAHLKRDFLPLHPANTVELVWTQVCIDIQYIVGFTLLLLALVLEASVNEVRSLVVVVLMVLVAAFTQHMANVVRALQDMVLHAEDKKTPEKDGEQRVSAPVFRFLNEGDACRVYLGFAFIFTIIYLIFSPRESQADPAMSVFVLTVFFFGAVSTGFDIIREVETKMTKTMWIAKHDVDKTRSYIMFFMIFMITLQSASAHYKYYDP